MANLTDKELSKKYKKLDDIEHVLLRPGRYIGSVHPHTAETLLLENGKFQKKFITYNPGFLKIFDEIVSNSVDEHRRNPKLNHIKVTINRTTGEITVRDNGGIPVQMHPDHEQYIPELVFSNLKAGSNFNDDDDARETAGTHGEGASLTTF